MVLTDCTEDWFSLFALASWIIQVAVAEWAYSMSWGHYNVRVQIQPLDTSTSYFATLHAFCSTWRCTSVVYLCSLLRRDKAWKRLESSNVRNSRHTGCQFMSWHVNKQSSSAIIIHMNEKAISFAERRTKAVKWETFPTVLPCPER